MNTKLGAGFAFPLLASLTLIAPGASPARAAEPIRATVEVEEEVYRHLPANNGAGPMWCAGSTCLVRAGQRVFVSGLETLEGVAPLNNCRWVLFERTPTGWIRQQQDDYRRTREPCPLAVLPGGSVFLSANPSLLDGRTPGGGPAQPELLEFLTEHADQPYRTLLPKWDGQPRFTEHTYRNFVADARRGELLLLQNIDYTHAEWAFRDQAGQWTAQGKLAWPWGKEYSQPCPVRLCYANAALVDRAVYFLGVSDIEEPNPQWRAYKHDLTGKGWDFDFRRLFFTFCPDITAGKFAPWQEIASREQTCGWIFTADLHVAPGGVVHMLWTERALDERLREKFFPDAKQSHALNYAQWKDGRVVLRRALIEATEQGPRLIPAAARFHVAPSGRLFVVCYVTGNDEAGNGVSENRLLELDSSGQLAAQTRIPLQQPFSSFFTATPRAGSAPAEVLDLLGTVPGEASAIRYARVLVQ